MGEAPYFMGEVDFIPAKAWRELGVEATLQSVEIATRVIEDFLKEEALDEPSEVARVLQLLDISAKFQEMAFDLLSGLAESYEFSENPQP